MQLRSRAVATGSPIAHRFTCDGEDLSRPFEGQGPPAATTSFAPFCDDSDAPAGTWHNHWAAFDLPANPAVLYEGQALHAFKQAANDFNGPSYCGPCPLRGNAPHRYSFRLLALSTEHLSAQRTTHCGDVEREAGKDLLAEATLVGTYRR